jgi:cytochrome P450 family 6
MRFGYLESKIGLVSLLSNFKFSITENTKVPMTFNKKAMTLSPDEEIILKVERL